MSWVILWLLVGGGSGLLMSQIEKRCGPPQDQQSRKREDRINLVMGTAFGPLTTALLPVAYFQSVCNRKALYGPDGNDSLQKCLNLKQSIRGRMAEIEGEMKKKQALLGGVHHLLEENFSTDAAQRAGIRPASSEMPSPEKVSRTCQEWLCLKQQKEALAEGLALTENRIAELRFGYQGILEASEIAEATLSLPEPVSEPTPEPPTEPEEASLDETEPPPREMPRPPGDIVRIVAWRQAEQLIGLRVRIRRSSRYANQNKGVGTIQCLRSFGWVKVIFDNNYSNNYRVGMKEDGLLNGNCDLELAEPTEDDQPFFDRMCQKLLGQPDRATLQRLIDGAKTHFLVLSFASRQVNTVFYLLDQLKQAKTKKFLKERGVIAGWFAREFGDTKLSLALADSPTPQDAVGLITYRLEQAARLLSEPEPPSPPPRRRRRRR